MNSKPPLNNVHIKPKGPKLSSAAAQARLADALRENLKRRKQQMRSRDAEAAVDKKDDDKSGDKT
jgi:hypothetical protein